MVTWCQTSPLRQYHRQFCMIMSLPQCMTLFYWVSITVSFAWSWADHCVWHSSTGLLSLSVLHDCELITVYDTLLLGQYHRQFRMIVSWSLCVTLLYWVSLTVSFARLWADHSIRFTLSFTSCQPLRLSLLCCYVTLLFCLELVYTPVTASSSLVEVHHLPSLWCLSSSLIGTVRRLPNQLYVGVHRLYNMPNLLFV